jgi:hypothetical protein
VFAPESEGLARTFAGEVPSLGAFIAISETPTLARAYVSDGVEGHATLSDWFKGPCADGRFSLGSGRTDGLFSNSLRLDAVVTDASATGTVTLPDGSGHPFVIGRSGGIGGPYNARPALAGEKHLLGIVMLDDGRKRGAIINASSVSAIGPITGDLAATRHGPDRSVVVTVPEQLDDSGTTSASLGAAQATRGGTVAGTQYVPWWDHLPR